MPRRRRPVVALRRARPPVRHLQLRRAHKDAGKPCRNRSDCEHLCVTNSAPRIGAEATGECTAVRTTFGCFTHVDGGRIVGRVCVD